MASINDQILALNAGSSSLKFALYRQGAELSPHIRGKIEGIGRDPRLHAGGMDGTQLAAGVRMGAPGGMHESFVGPLLEFLEENSGARLSAAGHRFVHGGKLFSQPIRIGDAALEELAALQGLAPLHQPRSVAIVRSLTGLRPALAQVACFDTAFHSGRPMEAKRYALPREIEEEGVIRYGFHGLSYEYVVERLAEIAPALTNARIIAAHLGNGCSLCAITNGRSLDTTMGFSPLEGIPMSTRCGTIDAGVLLYLLKQNEMSVPELEDLLYNRSGLLGVSGLSGDVRDLMANSSPRAAEALDLFVYRINREIGSLAALMGGVDALVFTGGIGEHQPEIRARICARAAWLGIALDEEANAFSRPCITRRDASPSAWVVPTDEELIIARRTRDLAGI